jgi:hypothetical protein
MPPLIALSGIEMFTPNRILQASDASANAATCIILCRVQLLLILAGFEFRVEGRLRDLRDRGCSQRLIVIRQVHLVHQVVDLLLKVRLSLVKIRLHDGELSG